MVLFIISFVHRPRTKDDLRAYCILLQVRTMQYFYVSMCLFNLLIYKPVYCANKIVSIAEILHMQFPVVRMC